MLRGTIIRAFDGTLADAEGLLEVERATFDESPYSPEQVQTMLTTGSAQRAWLAIGEGHVVGFIVAFPTAGLRGPHWEIDLLAVHPNWTGGGVATRLIRAAAGHGIEVARRARAVVAQENPASARAFTRAGFRRAERCKLFIQRIQGSSPQPWTALGVIVRKANHVEEVANLLAEGPGTFVRGGQVTSQERQEHRGSTLLLAERSGQPAGYAELIEVQTLLYRGVWIEALVASEPIVRATLIHEAVSRAIVAGLDEIGVMVPARDRSLQEALLEAGFGSLGDFDWLAAELPLPGLASSRDAGEIEVGQAGEDHV